MSFKLSTACLISLCAMFPVGCLINYPASVENLEEAKRFITRGNKAVLEGELETARAHYEIAEELGLEVDGLLGQGVVATRMRELDEAETLFQRVRALAPTDAYALGNLGVLCHLRERYQCAGHYYERALRADPTAVEFRNNLAIVFLSTVGRRGQAMKEFQKAYSVLPHPYVRSNIKALEGANERGKTKNSEPR